MSRLGTLGHNLYTGQVSFDFVNRWRRWIAVSGVVIIIGLVGLFARGLQLGLEFKGGSQFTFDNKGFTSAQVQNVVSGAGGANPVVQVLGGTGVGNKSFQVETKALDPTQTTHVVDAIKTNLNVSTVSTETVGSNWGQQITDKAIESLIIFIVAIVIYLSLRYEWKMAAAAIIALLHDMVITVGIYALVGFDVSPSTVIGFLTILGYSLYDTVVVFDKVRENTREIAGGSRMTYSQAANLAVNQTLVRSINTSIIALLPVGSLLFVGAGLLGAGSLKDLALALFVGLATGTYSSIFIATPLASVFKEREPQYRALAKRVAARQGGGSRTPAVALATAGAGRPARESSARESSAPRSGDDTGGAVEGGADPGEDSPGRAVPPAARAPSGAVRRPATRPRRSGGRPSGKKRRR